MRIRDWSAGLCSSDLLKEGISVTDSQALLCPTCRVNLTMSERQGIEIDYCPQCRGVWLDRGELAKIIERSDAASGPAPRASTPPPPPQPETRDPRYADRHPRKPTKQTSRKRYLQA